MIKKQNEKTQFPSQMGMVCFFAHSNTQVFYGKIRKNRRVLAQLHSMKRVKTSKNECNYSFESGGSFYIELVNSLLN